MRPFPTRPIGLLSSLCLPAALTTLSDLLDRLNSFGNFDVFLYIQHVYFPARWTNSPFLPKVPYSSLWLNDRRTGRETRGKWRWGGARRDWALVAGVIGRTPEAGHAYLTSLAVYRLFQRQGTRSASGTAVRPLLDNQQRKRRATSQQPQKVRSVHRATVLPTERAPQPGHDRPGEPAPSRCEERSAPSHPECAAICSRPAITMAMAYR